MSIIGNLEHTLQLQESLLDVLGNAVEEGEKLNSFVVSWVDCTSNNM